jgi:hypothetical protein
MQSLCEGENSTGICTSGHMPAIFATLSKFVVTTILPFPVERVRARLVCLRACESVPVPAHVHERGSAVTFEHTRVHGCSNTSVCERVR